MLVGVIVLLVDRKVLRPIDGRHAFLARIRPKSGGTPAPPHGSEARAAGGGARVTAGRSLPTVFLDPGHGGIDTGTVGTTASGETIYEKNIALAVVNRIAEDLRRDRIQVVLSPGPATIWSAADEQTIPATGSCSPRMVFLPISTGRSGEPEQSRRPAEHPPQRLSDPSVGGTQTFYDGARPFADQNQRFASLVQSSVIAGFAAQGMSVPYRGASDDQDLQAESLGELSGITEPSVLLGPAVTGRCTEPDARSALRDRFPLESGEADAIAQDRHPGGRRHGAHQRDRAVFARAGEAVVERCAIIRQASSRLILARSRDDAFGTALVTPANLDLVAGVPRASRRDLPSALRGSASSHQHLFVGGPHPLTGRITLTIVPSS